MHLPGIGHERREGVVVPRGGVAIARVPLEAVLEEAPRVDRRGQHQHEEHVEGGARLRKGGRSRPVKSE